MCVSVHKRVHASTHACESLCVPVSAWVHVHPHVCLSVCVIVAASVYARFACVCACMHTITTVDDALVGIICHIVAMQDIRYYCIVTL